MRKHIKAGVCILLLCLVTASVPMYSNIVAQVTKLTAADTIVIDAGHGGMDGGATSASGVLEKDINLSISKEIQRLADKDGWRVVMTREDDRILGKQEGSIRNKKTQDLKARKEIINRESPILTVSIHLNSFKEDRSVRGAQVFYPAGPGDEEVLEGSKRLAEIIQSEIVSGINDGTNRVALQKQSVLIFKNPISPIAIVECGFLSNHDESKLLQSKEYQQKMAECVYAGIMKYTGKSQADPVEIVDSLYQRAGFK